MPQNGEWHGNRDFLSGKIQLFFRNDAGTDTKIQEQFAIRLDRSKTNQKNRNTSIINKEPSSMKLSHYLLAVSAAICGMSSPGSEKTIFIKQNFDSAEFAPGILKSNWDGNRPFGGCKDYNNSGDPKQSGMEVVTDPVVSAPHALKIKRTCGGYVAFYRNSSIPLGQDYEISFKAFIPAGGQTGMIFVDSKDKQIGGVWLAAGKKLRAYWGNSKEFSWKECENIIVPTGKFFTLTVFFNAAIQKYRIGIDSENSSVLSDRRYPALNDSSLSQVRFMDGNPAGSYGVIDDLEVRYSSEKSVPPEDYLKNYAAATPLLQEKPAWLKLPVKLVGRHAPAEGVNQAGETLVYGCVLPFQLSATQAGAFVNLGVYTKTRNYDIEDGTDVVIFDSIDGFKNGQVIPIVRSGIEQVHGEERYFNRYPIGGGFVPYGAILKNGKPHPHAGTGFGVSQVLNTPPRPGDRGFMQDSPLIKRQTELFQFSYDGKKFDVKSRDIYENGNLSIGGSGWRIRSTAMRNAIPDGEDMLHAVWADGTKDGKPCLACGVCRWKRIQQKWQPVEFTPVVYNDQLGEHSTYEPSLVSLSEKEFYFAVRDDGHPHFKWQCPAVIQDSYVWRSDDGGKTWESLIHVEKSRPASPTSLGRTAEGKLFLLCNKPAIASPYYAQRNYLAVMALNDAKSRIMEHQIICDAFSSFGKNITGNWFVDHPTSMVIRLSDGKYHTVAAFRVRDNHLIPGTEKSMSEPSKAVGAYLTELDSPVEHAPQVWKFKD